MFFLNIPLILKRLETQLPYKIHVIRLLCSRNFDYLFLRVDVPKSDKCVGTD